MKIWRPQLVPKEMTEATHEEIKAKINARQENMQPMINAIQFVQTEFEETNQPAGGRYPDAH
jgi:hypothetical protein